MKNALISQARKDYHKELLCKGVLTVDKNGVPSNADKDSKLSVAVVTGEPLPSRIASLALGTGDIDCVYHFALYELVESVKECGAEDALEMLDILIKGKRLKDISDLPLDLAV